MKKIEYVVGVNFDHAGHVLRDAQARLVECRAILIGAFGAFSEFDGRGLWAGCAEEVKLFVVWADVDLLKARGVGQQLAKAMAQECVAVSVSEVNFKLVGGAA